MSLLILEREKERDRETMMWERNIHLLPPICFPTWGRTHNLGMQVPGPGIEPTAFLVYGMTLQPTEHPGQG